MTSAILRRVPQALCVVWLAATLAFAAMKLTPGDPAQALLAASGATPSEIAAERARLGLDDPVLVQYVRYLGELLRGNLGSSWLHGRPVSQMITERAGPTISLALAALTVGTALGVALGLVAAARQGTWLDTLVTGLAVTSLSIPVYWSGLLAILLFSLGLGWLPSSGEGDLRHLILPATVLGVASSGSIARLVRARMIEVLQAPYVTAARGRGLSGWHVLTAHVLRAALPSTVTVIALQLGFLLGGAVVTEAVFARRGLGQLALESIQWRDLPVVRGIIVFAAVAYMLTSLAADLVHAWLDPRLREDGLA